MDLFIINSPFISMFYLLSPISPIATLAHLTIITSSITLTCQLQPRSSLHHLLPPLPEPLQLLTIPALDHSSRHKDSHNFHNS